MNKACLLDSGEVQNGVHTSELRVPWQRCRYFNENKPRISPFEEQATSAQAPTAT